jgi:hypothetical protein
MNELTLQTEVARPKRWRLRFGMRGLIAAVLLLGLVFGGIARMERKVSAREALVAELARDHLVVVDHEPTYLCLIMMKVLATHSRDVEARCGKWIGPGWFYFPRNFNAGRLPDEKVPSVVERLQKLGEVHEVQYHGGSLDGLRLFYIGKIPFRDLGPHRDTCTIKAYPSDKG